MFYSQFILSKHGPLGTIWIAAHLERKLRKNQITETNISDSVDSILYPEVPIALRLSGHLLLGVVRIYSRKVNYLFHDCSEALIKIQQSFNTSAVNLPPGAVVAPYHSITLPETVDFYELEARIDRDNAAPEGRRAEFGHHVTARDLITLQDGADNHSYFRSLFTLDERFSESGNPYAILDMSNEEVAPQKSGSSKPVSLATCPKEMATLGVEEDVLPPLPIEEDMDLEAMDAHKDEAVYGDNGTGRSDVHEASSAMPVLNEDLEPQAKASEKEHTDKTVAVPDIERLRTAPEISKQEDAIGLRELDGDAMEVDDEPLGIVRKSDIGGGAQNLEETPVLREETSPFGPQGSSPIRSPGAACEDCDILGTILGGRTPKLEVIPTPSTTRQDGRKRKQSFDEMMGLSSLAMKKQLKSTSDICRVRRKAPSTEYEIWMSRRDNHVEKKFLEPSIPGLCAELMGIINRVFSGKHRPSLKDLQFDHGTSKLQTEQAQGEKRNDDPIGVVDKLKQGSGLEEPLYEVATHHIEIKALSIPQADQLADFLKGKALDIADEAHLVEPASPTSQASADLVLAGKLGNWTEFIEEVSNVGAHLQSSLVDKDKNMENGSAASVEPQQDGNLSAPVAEIPQVLFEVAKPQGLGFLADSCETAVLGTDGAMNEVDNDHEHMDNIFEDNSGWSSRTRAVAHYLKEKFEVIETARKPDTDQASELSFERLLTGRTQREAVRMFFETLVLRTKDYLLMEQDMCYSDIHLFPTLRLLKAVI